MANKLEIKLLEKNSKFLSNMNDKLSEMSTTLTKICETNNISGKKRKKKKDPNAPKGPRGPWIIFCNHMRPRYVKSFPDLSNDELRRKMANDWKSLETKKKQKFLDAATKDKERYKTEMKAYNAKKEQDAAANVSPSTSTQTPTKTTPKKRSKSKTKTKDKKQEIVVEDSDDDLSVSDLSLSDDD